MCPSLRIILNEPRHTKIYTLTFIIVMLKVSYVIELCIELDGHVVSLTLMV